MKLVDDWKSAWRWFSMHALVLAGIIPTETYCYLLDRMFSAFLPHIKQD
ncbi:hypothetical protein HV175_19385 [Klebsiella oxytoca]|nr:hypothetical protein HV175_19385 [Klebsiella oxytoca]